MSKFLQRLTGQDSSASSPSNLTPLAKRLIDGLGSLGENNAQIGLLVRSLEKHMARSPIPDDEIRDALYWGRNLIDTILGRGMDDAVVATSLTDADMAYLTKLSSDEPLFPPVSISPDVIETTEWVEGDATA